MKCNIPGMKCLMYFGLLLGIVAIPSAQQPAPPAQAAPPLPPAVAVGQAMPDFTLPFIEPAPPGGRPQTRQVQLSDYKGKQPVVLAFFPAAFSPG